MKEVEMYLVSDYNPKYLDGAIEVAIKRIMSNVKSDLDVLQNFNVKLEDKVEGLSQNSAKAVLRMNIEADTAEDSEAIYSVTASSSRGIQSYS